MATMEELARAVQHHVPEQPWSYCGNNPVPLEITYSNGIWKVAFVVSLSPSGKTRRWSNARGTSLYAALEAARKIQEGKE